MSLSGNYTDLHLELFKGIVDKEVQQEGSVLGGIFTEMPISAHTTTFHKKGKASSKIKAQKNEVRSSSVSTFEERNLTTKFIYSDETLDIEELGNIVENPKSTIVQDMMYELGRQKDALIKEGLLGTQVVIADGSSTNQALTISIAVDNHDFDDGTGDVGLTVGKIMALENEIKSAHGAMPGESLVVIAPFRQLAKLATQDDVKNMDKHVGKPVSSPGIYQGVQGVLGHNYIAYEELGLDASGHEKVVMCTRDALFVGIKTGMTAKMGENPNLVGFSEVIEVHQEIGVARRDENKVGVAACLV